MPYSSSVVKQADQMKSILERENIIINKDKELIEKMKSLYI